MCGEKEKARTQRTVRKGSPPHVRGKGITVAGHIGNGRITPAYAGKRESRSASGSACRDHPRMCGEKPAAGTCSLCQKGSPPRMRGKEPSARPWPAPFGITPRMCGEKSGAEHFPYKKVIRSFTCGSACRSGRIMPGISSISVSSAHNGHQSKAIGLAAPHALTQQCPELLCIGHLQNALIGHC